MARPEKSACQAIRERLFKDYLQLGYSEKTAKQYFKRDIRERAEQIVRLNAKNVVALAEYLRQSRFVDGAEATEIILSPGPLTTGDVLKEYHL